MLWHLPMTIGVSLNIIFALVVAICVNFVEEGTVVDKNVLVRDEEWILYEEKFFDVDLGTVVVLVKVKEKEGKRVYRAFVEVWLYVVSLVDQITSEK